MKAKTVRMKTLKMLISSKELSSQEEVLKALAKEGFTITQATLSRDLKQLKVAKAASMNGNTSMCCPTRRCTSVSLRLSVLPTWRIAMDFFRSPLVVSWP